MCHPGSRKQVAIGFLQEHLKLQEGILEPKGKHALVSLPVLPPSTPAFQEHLSASCPVLIQMLPWKPRYNSST